jgi:hypothetical protein
MALFSLTPRLSSLRQRSRSSETRPTNPETGPRSQKGTKGSYRCLLRFFADNTRRVAG